MYKGKGHALPIKFSVLSKRHHLFNDGDRISRRARHAQLDYAVKPLGVAFAAYIVSVHAASLAVFFLMAYLTFHQHIGFEICKWCFADQAFFVHNFLPVRRPFQ